MSSTPPGAFTKGTWRFLLIIQPRWLAAIQSGQETLKLDIGWTVPGVAGIEF
jgi:hypothetical protein